MTLNQVCFAGQAASHTDRLSVKWVGVGKYGVFEAKKTAAADIEAFKAKLKKELPDNTGALLWCTDVAGSGPDDWTHFGIDLFARGKDGKIYLEEHSLDKNQTNGHDITLTKFRRALNTAFAHAQAFAKRIQEQGTAGLKPVLRDDNMHVPERLSYPNILAGKIT